MEEITKTTTERAILVSVKMPDVSQERIDEYLDELEMLTYTAGAETLMKITQDRYRLDSAYYIGKGKAEEIAELAKVNQADLVVFDDDLTPTQARNLEKLVNKKIVDRSGLILDIFAAHAKTNEAKTQVELAQLQYILPRLTRAWTHLSKQHGGIGTKGPGETQIETDRRLIRGRISKLKQKLEKIESQQVTKSLGRKDFTKVTLVGYTNAGKSTLLNLLTGAEVLAENKLFATLDSTTRLLDFEQHSNILMSDTVGFIRKLPHHLVASFKSTLNVARDADIILHVVDASHPYFGDHIEVVENTLKELGIDQKKMIKVFNKVDALEDSATLDYIRNNYDDPVMISAARGMNIGLLKEKIVDAAEGDYVKREIALNHNESRMVAHIHSLAEVLSTTYDDDKINITYRTGKTNNNKIEKLLDER